MKKRWHWINPKTLELLHDESLAVHGGAPGLRDRGLLESALARPEQLAAYGEPDFADLAAAYAVGVAKNHPFVDGNKRAAFLTIGLFLWANGYRLVASQAEATLTMLSVASGELDEAALSIWLRANVESRSIAQNKK